MKKLFFVLLIILAITAVNIAYYMIPEDIQPAFKWGVRVFNFLLFAGLLVFALRKPANEYFDDRKTDIKESLRNAERQVAEAETKLKEAQAKLDGLKEEIEGVAEQAGKEGKKEERKLKEEADRTAEKIMEKADREIQGKLQAARKELREYAAELSISIAREKIGVEIGDRERNNLFGEALERIKEEI